MHPEILASSQPSYQPASSYPDSLDVGPLGSTEGNYCQPPSPVPSTSDGTWMGYNGDETTPSPVSPVVDYPVSALARRV